MTQQMDRAPMPVVPSPGRVGQGTAIEQSRAAAQVLAAVEVAHRFPRDVGSALAEMRQSCQQMTLAERAFYRYPRGGQSVSGPTIHLARELARCWGHIDYGLVEMRRDDEYHQSEMLAFAWDLQTNARNSSAFIVPHKRDTRDGPQVLTDMRDVYEMNTNQGSRRVREAIFAVLPPWLVDQAKSLCTETLKDGGGIPLPTRIANAVEKFGSIGVNLKQLETKVERKRPDWTEHDVAQLGVIFKSIERREVRKEEEFPPPAATADEILAARSAPAQAVPAVQARPVDADAEAARQAAGEGDPLRYSAEEIAEMGGGS